MNGAVARTPALENTFVLSPLVDPLPPFLPPLVTEPVLSEPSLLVS